MEKSFFESVGRWRVLIGLFFIFLLFCSPVQLQNPGLRASINQSFLNEVNSLMPLFLYELSRNLTLPSRKGHFTIPIAGEVNWTLVDPHFTQLSLVSSKTIIQQGQITEAVVDATLELESNYTWVAPEYQDKGTVTILIQDVSISFNVEVSESNGRPTVASSNCQFSVGGALNFTFHGSIAWIYNDLEKAIDPVIVFLVENLVPPLVEHAINVQAEEALSNLRIIVPDGDYLIDFTMMGPPYWAPDDSYFSFAVKGMYEPRAHPQPCPYTASPLPYSLSDEMLQIYVGDYFVNCASWAHYVTGFLDRTYSPSNVPSGAEKLIETNTYKYIVPPLYQQYPDHFLSYHIYASQVPNATFSTSGITLTGLGEIDASVITGTDQLTPVFSIGLVLTVQLEAVINDTNNYVYGQIQNMGCDMTLINDPIGPFDFTLLNAFLVGVCQYLIPTSVNIYMENFGIPIPVFENFEAVNPQIVYGNGYVGAYSSLKFVP